MSDLTPEQIQKVKDFGILKKTKEGKRLTKAEQQRLDEMQGKADKLPDFVTSGAKLSTLIGIHRNTFAAWKDAPDAPPHTPKGFDVKAWLDYAQKRAKRAAIEKPGGKYEKEMIKLDEQIRGLKISNDNAEGILWKRDEVVASITALVSELNSEIRKIEDGLPQALMGLGIPEQRIKIRECFDAMRSKIHKGEKTILSGPK